MKKHQFFAMVTCGCVLMGAWLAGGLLFPKSKLFPKKERERVVEADLVSPVEKKQEPEEVDQEQIKQAPPVAMPERIVVAAPQSASVPAGPELAPMSLGDLESALNPGGGAGLAVGGGRIGGGRGFGGGGGVEDGAFSLNDIDERPKVVNQVRPSYPVDLKRQKIDGRVIVAFTVDREGRVIQPRAEEATHPSFAQAALDAVRQWRFEPGVRGGRKVATKLRVPIAFRPPA
ncbi:MAG TPA: energy transducer TonB [Verrucomicrobiae bacterium]|nr:energy transducer TonB [Verrucomicrobiae bacterium]